METTAPVKIRTTGSVRGRTAICAAVTNKRIFVAIAGAGPVQFMEVTKKDFRKHIRRMNRPEVETLGFLDRPEMIWITAITETEIE